MNEPSQIPTRTRRFFVRAGVASAVAWGLLEVFSPPATVPWTPEMVEAASGMAAALEVIAEECSRRGIEVDRALDPNGTCLIGPEDADLFTSLGQVEAKRSTLAPDVAGLMVFLLDEAGVEEGDTVAVGASGSFPGFLVATVMAVEAMGAVPRSVLSLGASSFGATRPEFHLLDIYELLRDVGLVADAPAAVSLGGSRDLGLEFPSRVREDLLAEIGALGLPLIMDEDLPRNVQRRLAAYQVGAGEGAGVRQEERTDREPEDGTRGRQEEAARGRHGSPPAAFVNIGGNEANLGVNPRVLEVPPGLSRDLHLLTDASDRESWGVLFAMADMGVPVLHLLHVRGLALRYGLPWDPIPLPPVASTRFQDSARGRGALFWALTALYVGAMAALTHISFRSRMRGATPDPTLTR